MTGAEFNDRFQLVRQVTDGRVRTFHAVASTGAVVMVHIVDAGAAEESLALAELLGRLEPAEKPRILDVTEVDGSPVIITKFILEFTSLRDWLESHAVAETGDAAGPPPPEPPAAVPPPAAGPGPVPTHQEREPDTTGDADGPGEFTRLFRGVSPPPPAEPAPPPVETPPPAPPPAKEPGEFTREFMRAAQPPAPQAPPPTAAPPPADDAPPKSEPQPPSPGSFTQIFQSPFASGTDAKETGPAEPRREGEFTRMLRVASGLTGSAGGPAASPPPPPPPALPVEPAAPPPPPPATPKSSEPGEFTRWFARQADPAPPAPGSPPEFGIGGGSQPPPGGGSPDWLSRLREPGTGGPSHTAGPPSLPGPRAPAAPWGAPPAPPPQAGPGEYTRIFSAPAAPPPSPLPPPPPAPAKGPSRKLLIWGLVGIVVVTLLLIVLFAVLSRAGEPDAPAGDGAPADTAAATAPAAGR